MPESFFNRIAGLEACDFIKKRLWQRCFPINFAKFLRKPFLKNTSGRLLPYMTKDLRQAIMKISQ